MTVDRDVRVPVGPEAARWVTVSADRTVLAVARTVTSTLRVLDAVEAFAGDHRVQVVFAVNGSSPFGDGVDRLLREAGARVLPWRQVSRVRFDVVVTASENTELDGIDAPVLVLPHGIGFHKLLPDSRGPGRRLSGSLRAEDIADLRVLVAVSHPDQAEQLRTHSPHLADRTVVVADTVYERLRASTVFRDRYRRALGTGARRLVLLSSTWGRQSLLGRWPDLPARLLGQLPADEYQIVVVLHPNVWSGHGALQVRSWLADAREGGLLTIPPERGWPAVLLAADCVIADHGSLSLYAAGVDRPLLLAPFGDEVVPGTALSGLGDLAPRLDAGRSLADQIAAAIAGHRPGQYQEVVSAAFAAAPVARSVRSVLYELLSLPEPPGGSRLRGWPEPAADGGPVTSYAVYTRQPSRGVVQVRRIPAAVDTPAAAGAGGWLRQLAVDEQEWDLRMVHSASVVTRPEESTMESAETWARTMLDRHPGARVAAAATGDGCVTVLRDGRRIDVSIVEGWCAVMIQAACVSALMRAGDWAEVTVVRIGESTTRLRVRPAEPG